ncbi:hypothetical protein Ae168Ps1_6361 [Pseudonocardia sp. Ae168_Ps1]|uniref:MinD/ParA family ATP-binding protein n=1 Tax=unclassified Pseudonocardia TaxID=2619320 RepID=UPI00095A8833|nr:MULTISPECIES: MinD/ParA family protein [unclassified Pseudonocardia]OLL69896.1 hypothetical protein Ae150APs1_6206c [Pseudonocardia sp. Ae150A_Ps1]OLL70124.1 hypothetical protein Ae168Ps1_6361 [Pseudonocardia sp. Ae168_Ps1]OLL70395.1 hypothetical protein Ae263Ps1_6339 [Pseudonocardia sp. Ae263_Ps1]OLL89176.1 hypothetical protein Ae356Ps1_6204 [Pseudonocardia sp. Ae356_Ps1]
MGGNNMFQQGWDEEGAPPAPRVEPRPRPQEPIVALNGKDGIGKAAVGLKWPPENNTEDDGQSPKEEPTATTSTASADAESAAKANPESAATPAAHRDDPHPVAEIPAELKTQGPRYLSSQTLNHDSLTKHRADIPQYGWRRAVYRMTGGLLNPGIGEVEKARQQLRERVRRRLHAPHRVAVLSVKGGIGKTTLTACIGFAMADIRGDQVSVIDANPDAGTLADRLTGDSSVNIRHLLRDLDKLDALTDVTSYMTLAGRLKVLASDQDPATSEALTAKEYERAARLLSKYFNLVFTDCGTGISHDTMTPTLEMAHSVVVIGSPTVDGSSRAGHTLDWLESHGYTEQARNAIVVLNCKDSSDEVDEDRIAEHFRTRVRAVVSLPHDPHLASGGRIDFRRLRLSTKDVLTEIGAFIADGFPEPYSERTR